MTKMPLKSKSVSPCALDLSNVDWQVSANYYCIYIFRYLNLIGKHFYHVTVAMIANSFGISLKNAYINANRLANLIMRNVT